MKWEEVVCGLPFAVLYLYVLLPCWEDDKQHFFSAMWRNIELVTKPICTFVLLRGHWNHFEPRAPRDLSDRSVSFPIGNGT